MVSSSPGILYVLDGVQVLQFEGTKEISVCMFGPDKGWIALLLLANKSEVKFLNNRKEF